ncbi:universal stress protein [Paractinoplanes rishiriensis]|uniref:Universal stress protein n=1 Tax=Paractinoplanes rishiriensis TaxID=1050105 RepID=A0A919JWY9_9ACTN|nr:universal stress protein [Actinoplanes rishiriensis]GIE94827.1 universal stress protein [Actinoplanes rishiriensis]
MTGPIIAGAPGEAALQLGRWYAEALGLPLLVAVVHPAPAALGSGRVDAEWVADRHRAAEQVLDEARKLLAGTSGEVEYRTVASSSAAHGLHDLAEEVHATAVVVGSGGSTAERLLSGNPCPVMVAPAQPSPRPGTVGRIGVAYVDTPDGRAALAGATRLAERTGLPLRLYTVVADSEASLPFLIGRDAERAFLDTARETYEQALHTAVGSVAGVQSDWRIENGDVVATLAELEDVDVLFCGSRGYGPARRVLLGGVSARLVRRARRPVVVVPRSG